MSAHYSHQVKGCGGTDVVLTRMLGLKLGHVVHILINDDPKIIWLLMCGNVARREGFGHCDSRGRESDRKCCGTRFGMIVIVKSREEGP